MEFYLMQPKNPNEEVWGGRPVYGSLLKTLTGRRKMLWRVLTTHRPAFSFFILSITKKKKKPGPILGQNKKKIKHCKAKRKFKNCFQWPVMFDSPCLGTSAVGHDVNLQECFCSGMMENSAPAVWSYRGVVERVVQEAAASWKVDVVPGSYCKKQTKSILHLA